MMKSWTITLLLPIAIAACNSDGCMDSLDGKCGGSALFDVAYCGTDDLLVERSYNHSDEIVHAIQHDGRSLHVCRITTNFQTLELFLSAEDSADHITFISNYGTGERIVSLNQNQHPFGISVYHIGKTNAQTYLGNETKTGRKDLDTWAESTGNWIAKPDQKMPKFAQKDEVIIAKKDILAYISDMEKQAGVPRGTIDRVAFSFSAARDFPITCQVISKKGERKLLCQIKQS